MVRRIGPIAIDAVVDASGLESVSPSRIFHAPRRDEVNAMAEATERSLSRAWSGPVYACARDTAPPALKLSVDNFLRWPLMLATTGRRRIAAILPGFAPSALAEVSWWPPIMRASELWSAGPASLGRNTKPSREPMLEPMVTRPHDLDPPPVAGASGDTAAPVLELSADNSMPLPWGVGACAVDSQFAELSCPRTT